MAEVKTVKNYTFNTALADIDRGLTDSMIEALLRVNPSLPSRPFPDMTIVPFGWTAIPTIKKVIVNGPATIVIWGDGSKTVVKCEDGDKQNVYVGVLWCIAKKVYGTHARFERLVDSCMNLPSVPYGAVE